MGCTLGGKTQSAPADQWFHASSLPGV